MENQRRIVSEIMHLISDMETQYPEIYRFLDEDPITIPSSAQPELNQNTLAEYSDDLRELLKRHLQSHQYKSS